MKPARKLSLNSERLVELAPDALAGVAGGREAAPTQPLDPCLSLFHCYPTRNVLRCLTNPCAD